MEITLAIIGTAGREEDAKKLSMDSYKAMCIVAGELLKQLKEINYPITHVVSGGSAWADHVAVTLYLEGKVTNLRLFIPCDFIDGQYVDKIKLRTALPSATNTWKTTPGSTLNYYHSLFQRETGINSLSEIQVAATKGAEIYPCSGGFYGRNAMVAKSDFLLAMTFGQKNEVKEGGTADTVRKYLSRVDKEGFFNKSFHYNLTDGILYKGIAVPAKEGVKKSRR